jgi:hypothetical protein
MTDTAAQPTDPGLRIVLVAAAVASVLYAALVVLGDLRSVVPVYLTIHGVLLGLMLVGWRAVARGGSRALRAMLVAAVLFRLVAAAAPPSLSDDVYRYVWDGRVQVAGHHPYRFAPDDPRRSDLRDDVWGKINHPEIPTIYPPFAELVFAALALMKLGITGFKFAFALLDVGVILALARLLRALGLPRDRVVLYAWNPLAVVEVAASGHVEPLGLSLLVLAVALLVEGKMTRAAAALGLAVQAKLLPLILVPGFVRRLRTRAVLVGIAVVLITTAPYAIRGPWFGGGALAYAHHWEHGAVIFALVRRLYSWLDTGLALRPAIAWAQARWGGGDTSIWNALYTAAWPQELARWTVAAAAFGWAIAQSFRRKLDAAQETRLAIGGVILLAPTLHPWYVLWILPFAAAQRAGGWLLLAALIPLQYLAASGDVPWILRLAILLPPVAWMLRDTLLGSHR